MEAKYLLEKASEIRLGVLDLVYNAKSSHVGTAFSCADILIALYFSVMDIDPQNPSWKNRDRFVLSKGHGCTALYSILALRGFFSKEELETYGKDGTKIACHTTLGHLPGIEASTGSEGHGLALGIGMALALRNQGIGSHVFVLTGDGECQEGSIWEGIAFAGHHKLNNLTIIVDRNMLQIMGRTSEIIDLGDLESKIKLFGWDARTINGHDFKQILDSLDKKKVGSKPRAVIANTIKGKGVSFMENKPEWHGKYPNQEEYLLARKELGGQI